MEPAAGLEIGAARLARATPCLKGISPLALRFCTPEPSRAMHSYGAYPSRRWRMAAIGSVRCRPPVTAGPSPPPVPGHACHTGEFNVCRSLRGGTAATPKTHYWTTRTNTCTMPASDIVLSMDRGDIAELFYITAIANLPSIVDVGILSHASASTVQGHRSVANESVQTIRSTKRVPGGALLHTYANLYICVRNAMLFSLRDRYDDICVLGIDPAVLDMSDVVITDCNAAVGWVTFRPVTEGLSKLDGETIFAVWWWHPDDPVRTDQHRAAMMAEVLVPHSVPADYIRRIYVANEMAMRTCQALGITLPITLRAELFP